MLILAGGGWLGWYCWRWMRNTQLTLRADRIMHTGWNRPLLWADVASLSAVNHNGGIRVTFHLKQKAPPFSRWTLIKTQRRSVPLSLQSYAIKQQELLVLIHRYHARQVDAAQ